MTGALLSIEDLHVSFATRRNTVDALRGVTLAVNPGETLGVVGESGSGKSVTALAAMHLLDRAGRVSSGRIVFQGEDITHLSASALRAVRGSRMSMIFQNPRAALNPIRTVGLQIADAIRAHRRVSQAAATERALDLLRLVLIRDPETRLNAYPHELSGGMCQRVIIAMAIACEPDLLIADEPTTGLDVSTQKAIMDLIAGIAAERAMGVIFITHDLGLAAKYCGRVVVMKDGRVVEQAAPNKLFNAPRDPYTQRLVAASPTKVSRIEDLVVEEGVATLSRGPVFEQAAARRSAVVPLPVGERVRVRGLRRLWSDGRTSIRAAQAGERYNTIGASAPHPNPLPNGERERAEFGAISARPTYGSSPLLRVTGLTKRFGASTAVDGVSFAINAGESVGLVGESGSGKSTISRIVCRLLDQTEGEIRFDGTAIDAEPARTFNRSALRKDIQIVFQDAHDSLNPRFSAFDCIAHPLRKLMGIRGRAVLTERVFDCARRVGLPLELLDRFPHQLSGGQKARVGIARGIATGPRLLVLDEPTAALDVSVQAVILQLLVRLRQEENLSYLFVSHDLNVVRMLCDRTIVLRNGRIVEQGRSSDLFANPADPYTRDLLAAIPEFNPTAAVEAKVAEPAIALGAKRQPRARQVPSPGGEG
ncbi:ABC transporter ATP-binding protein [Bradyrhizobium sp. LHD-71]|uniref:ABC transporter ATP-binding protein n=1 Tax=Bradyrhizobium sp. LHD-71 TaxID=3072141 RepID=UPI00280DF70C|nr:ABC transporter ATP-binding protein [Bradyrhizobium sp. LHD-71]MDQ8730744.1 ABC transporter ATP-binding protein [Bradyrhizobium sp. LHD-71]